MPRRIYHSILLIFAPATPIPFFFSVLAVVTKNGESGGKKWQVSGYFGGKH